MSPQDVFTFETVASTITAAAAAAAPFSSTTTPALALMESTPPQGHTDSETAAAGGAQSARHYAMGSALAVVSALTVCGNLLVLLVFLRTPQLRTPTYCFLISLAFADFVSAPSQSPLLHNMSINKRNQYHKIRSKYQYSIIIIMCTERTIGLCRVSEEPGSSSSHEKI